MPLPLVVGIGIAAGTALAGVGGAVSAGVKNHEAKDVNKTAEQVVELSKSIMEEHKAKAQKYICKLGETKLTLASSELRDFVDVFSKLKEVNLLDSMGIEELTALGFDTQDVKEMLDISTKAGTIVSTGLAGIGTGALVGFGVYGCVQALGTAGTGTAIATLSGVTASNATLAWLGGGTLAAGGLGTAGGVAILGGLIAGPALMVIGGIASISAGKNLDNAYSNILEAKKLYEQVCTAGEELDLISSAAIIINANLKMLGKRLRSSINKTQAIVSKCDVWSELSLEDKHTVARTVKYAMAVKGFIDLPLLTDDGILTKNARKVRDEYFNQSNTVYSGDTPKSKISIQEIKQWKDENVNSPDEAMYIIDPVVNHDIINKIALPDTSPNKYIVFAAVDKSTEQISCYAIVDRDAVNIDDINKYL